LGRASGSGTGFAMGVAAIDACAAGAGAGAGEFVFVPPRIPHVEVNITGEEATFVVARSSGEPMIIPIEADLSKLAHLGEEHRQRAAAPV